MLYKHKAHQFRRIATTEVTDEKQNKDKNPLNRSLRGVMTWKDMPKHVWKSVASLLGKNVSALKLAETPCMDDHQCSPEDFNDTR